MANAKTLVGSAVNSADVEVADYCTITGYLRNLSGRAQRGKTLTFRYISLPTAVSTTELIVGGRLVAKSDINGKVSINLLQGSKVIIEIPGRHLDMVRECNIPESTSADLIDILFPRVTSITFETSSYTLSSGDIQQLSLVANLTDGTTESANSAVVLASSSSSVEVSGISIKAQNSGSATISISSVDVDKLSVRKEPDGDAIKIADEASPDITAQVTVTVS